MLFALRFILTALWLIFIALLFPDLRLGNRYLVLFEAGVIVYVSCLIRSRFSYRLISWKRALLDGCSVFLVLFLMKWLFLDINLTVTGLIMAYTGVSCFELLFPKQESAVSQGKSGRLGK